MTFLNRLLFRSNIQLLWSEFFSFSVMISSKNFSRIVLKWSCSVCIGICFSVYMVYSLMACLNYIASVLCIVCLFFLCAYTRWNGTKKLFAFLVKASLNYTRAALLFWQDTLELFVQLEKYSSCIGGIAVRVLSCHSACLLHWPAPLFPCWWDTLGMGQ